MKNVKKVMTYIKNIFLRKGTVYPRYTNIILLYFLPNSSNNSAVQLFQDFDKEYKGVMNISEILYGSDWETIMDCFITKCQKEHQIPILHLDMHGDPNYGFGIGNDIIGWDRLISKITELNMACNGQLFLSLNVCYGLNIYKHLMKNAKALSLKTLGSFNQVFANNGKYWFLKMYLEYFKSYSMEKAINCFMDFNRSNSTDVFALV